jgi:hypothetical protein
MVFLKNLVDPILVLIDISDKKKPLFHNERAAVVFALLSGS